MLFVVVGVFLCKPSFLRASFPPFLKLFLCPLRFATPDQGDPFTTVSEVLWHFGLKVNPALASALQKTAKVWEIGRRKQRMGTDAI